MCGGAAAQGPKDHGDYYSGCQLPQLFLRNEMNAYISLSETNASIQLISYLQFSFKLLKTFEVW